MHWLGGGVLTRKVTTLPGPFVILESSGLGRWGACCRRCREQEKKKDWGKLFDSCIVLNRQCSKSAAAESTAVWVSALRAHRAWGSSAWWENLFHHHRTDKAVCTVWSLPLLYLITNQLYYFLRVKLDDLQQAQLKQWFKPEDGDRWTFSAFKFKMEHNT